MPPMPLGSPQMNLSELLKYEEVIRTGGSSALPADPYWADLARLLLVHRLAKDGQADSIMELGREISDNCYQMYIEKRRTRLSRPLAVQLELL